MVGTINRGNHPAALWPGVKRWWGLEYNKFPTEYTDIFETLTSDKAYEEDVESSGFGLAPVKTEGGAISYDSHSQGPTQRYTHVTYGLGYIITREAIEDNQYDKLSRARTSMLAFSMRTTKEIIAANILNRAFNSSYVYADGKELIATDHPGISGAWSNELTTAADLAEASLEDMVIQLSAAKNQRNLPIAIRPRKLIIAPANMFEAKRILGSDLRVDTPNNDINALKAMGIFANGYSVNHYLDDPDAWFVLTDVPNGLTHYQRRAIDFDKDNDFDTENAKAKATERYSFGATDPRAIFGSAGA